MDCRSWQNTMIVMLRTLIDDSDGNDYSDSKLENILATSASIVLFDIPFFQPVYSVNITPPSIMPDPVSNYDKNFIYLVVLKSACLLDMSELRKNSLLSGLGANCGPAELRTYRRMNDLGSALESGYCASYESAKKDFISGNYSMKKAILSPFTNENFDPLIYGENDGNRR